MFNIVKRIIDITVSFFILLILSPFLLILVIILKLSGEHEAFYAQKRIGYNNKGFRLYKFVTMKKCNPNLPDMEFTLDNYSRVTAIGKFLRLTKINEIPQFFNVLKGDMSLVGPRPLIPVSFDMYPEEVKNKLFYLKPGLTGIGSIIFRNEESLVTEKGINLKEFYQNNIIPYKGVLETWYYENKNFKLDIIILFLTAWAIFFPKLNLHYKILRELPVERKQKIKVSEGSMEKAQELKLKEKTVNYRTTLEK